MAKLRRPSCSRVLRGYLHWDRNEATSTRGVSPRQRGDNLAKGATQPGVAVPVGSGGVVPVAL
jgi:hypothetical protein